MTVDYFVLTQKKLTNRVKGPTLVGKRSAVLLNRHIGTLLFLILLYMSYLHNRN